MRPGQSAGEKRAAAALRCQMHYHNGQIDILFKFYPHATAWRETRWTQ
jgi:hypothetical protein